MEVTLNGGEFFFIYSFIIFPLFPKWLIVRLNIDSQFQCRQCQDLLENNLAHKRPIEGLCLILSRSVCIVFLMLRFTWVVLIGKKNLEVRPTAVNKVRFLTI